MPKIAAEMISAIVTEIRSSISVKPCSLLFMSAIPVAGYLAVRRADTDIAKRHNLDLKLFTQCRGQGDIPGGCCTADGIKFEICNCVRECDLGMWLIGLAYHHLVVHILDAVTVHDFDDTG